jgi:hypothetical protein
MLSVIKSFRFFSISLGRGRCSPALSDQIILGGVDAYPVKPGVEGGVATEFR